jgi:hypothetical protein
LRLFPDFDQAPFRLEHDPKDINDILRWRGGALPTIFKDLQLVDERNNIRTNTPASSRIIEYLKSRSPEERRGSGILQHFTSPPFGWDEGIVRLVLAALFVNRSISATSDKRYASATESASHAIFTNSKIFLKTLFDLGGEVLKPEERESALEFLSEIFGKKARPTPDEIDAVLLPEVESRLNECKDLISKAQFVALPIINQLKQLENMFRQVTQAETPIQRILVFISSCDKEEKRNALKSQLKLLKRLKDFDLTKYFSASRFTQDVAPQLASVLKNSEPHIDEYVDSIRHSLNAEDFLDRWPSITTTLDKLKRLYKKTYEEQHLERHESVQEAVRSLDANALLKKLTDTKKQNYLKPLLDIDCAFQPNLDDAFACERCHATLASMAWNISTVGERRMQIESELEKIEDKGKKKPLKGFTETITKPADIPMTVKKVDQTARKAVSQGKSVTVRLEVD